MKGFEIRCIGRTFFVPEELAAAILIYQRHGYYYVDFEGWELIPQENHIPKNRFNLKLEPDDTIQLEIKTIDSDIFSKLIDSNIENIGFFPLLEEDFQQMTTKFHTLEKFLKKEGII